MATYAQINEILTETAAGAQTLREKVRIACLIAAQAIISSADTGDPWDQTAGAHDKRVLWVQRLLGAPDTVSREMFAVALAANAGGTQAAILGATDTAIQTTINESIDSLAANLT